MAAAAPSSPFNARLMIGLIAAGIVAFVAFAVLSAYAGDFRTGRDGRAHALSVSAVGFKGLVDLARHTGGNPHLVRSGDEHDTEDLVVVAVDERTDPEALAELIEFRGGRATLIILPKWLTQPDDLNSGWVHSAGLFDPDFIANRLGGIGEVKVDQAEKGGTVAVGQDWMDGVRVRVPARQQTLTGAEVKPLLAAPGGGALLARVGESPLYVLADPDLMNNHGLKDPRTARAAIQILDRLNSTDAEAVLFDLTLNGFERKANALKLAFEPPFLALTLSLFVAALLAGLHGAFRFGPEAREERAIALGKAALVENSAGLIRLARREHCVGGAYADVVAEEAGRASGAPASLRGHDLEAYLDRLSPPDARPFSQLAARAREAGNREQLISAARALFLWKKELMQ